MAKRPAVHDEPFALSPAQQAAVRAVRDGHNVFFTGMGGSGKSFLIDYLCENVFGNVEKVAITALTGNAAADIGGTTLHWFLGLRRVDDDLTIAGAIKFLSKRARDSITHTEVLIIDEISLAKAKLVDLFDQVLRNVRNNMTKPFGGMQVIGLGDPMQLPPVVGRYFFTANSWSPAKFVSIVAHRNFRQTNDAFCKILSDVRKGVVTEEALDLFARCDITRKPLPSESENRYVVKLFATNRAVDDENALRLQALPTPVHTMVSIDELSNGVKPTVFNDLPVPNKYDLKVGAQVIHVVNKMKEGLVNGSSGIVVDFSPAGFPIVRFNDGRKKMVSPHPFPILVNGKKIATRRQVPLILGWALTIHRCQGKTLDYVLVDAGFMPNPGQFYTAVSRVRTAAGLWLKNFKPSSIKVNELALKWLEELEQRQQELCKRKKQRKSSK